MKVKSARIILCLLLLVLFINNAHGASQSKRGVKVTPTVPPSFNELYGNSYAVIIGVNAYDKWPSLEYAVKDARAMEEKLKSLGFQTTILLDQHATKDNILKTLGDDLPQKVQKNDRVVIFFAGHGQTEELADGTQMGYIVPVDGDTRNIYSTAISMNQVREFSRRLRAKHVLYMIDSCYAGLGLTRSGTIPPSERDYLRKITTRKAHQMLTAGGKGEIAHEEGEHGVFTKYVLEALDGAADRDEKGFVTFSDIASYVKPKVSRYTGTKQIPQYGSIDGEGEFVFVLAGLPTAAQSDSSDMEKERQRIEKEKKRLEADRNSLATQRAQMEEQKRLTEEQRRLEEEKQRIAEEQARLRDEREALEKQQTEAVQKTSQSKKVKTRAWLGVSVQDVTEDIAKELNLIDNNGALVSEVFKGDPADKAGLRSGDIITEANGKKIKVTRDLLLTIASLHVGDKVKIKSLRDGEEKLYQIFPTWRKEQREVAPAGEITEQLGVASAGEIREDFGMTVQDISPDIARRIGVVGVVVFAIKDGSPADGKGIRLEDIILEVNKVKISSMKDYVREISKTSSKKSILLLIRRGNSTFFVSLRN
jgi:uncharacterized caspase-like protein